MLNEQLLAQVELMLRVLNVTSRKMFGGIGIFSEKIMFSMIYDGIFYFRSTEDVASVYSQDSIQFQHPSRDSKMPYWSVPEKVLTDEAKFTDWAQNAFLLAKSLKKK